MKSLLIFLVLISIISLISCASNPEIRPDPVLDRGPIQGEKINAKDPLGLIYYPQTPRKEIMADSMVKGELTAPIFQAPVREELSPTPSAKEEVSDKEDEGNPPREELPLITLNPKILEESQMVGHDALIEKELKRIMAEFGEKDSRVPPIFLNEVKAYIKTF